MPSSMSNTLILLAAAATTASAQPIVVDTLQDVYDTGVNATVADLPGPDGKISMREATYAANNTPGPHTIEFAIPESEFYLEDSVALLRLEDGPWVFTANDITIDFSSQAQNIGDTNPAGPEVGIYGWQVNGWGAPAIYLQGDNCTVKGLGKVYSRAISIRIIGSHNRVVGCKTLGVEIDQGWQGPPATFNTVGGTEPGDANDLEFVDILSWADDNVVIGNRIDTVLVSGSPYSTFPKRNRIGGPTEAERNVINGFGYRSGEGYPTGQGVLVNFAEDTLIENNYIGVDETGTQRVPQIGPEGIEVRDSINTTIANNLISGVWVQGSNHSQGLTFGVAIRVTAINRDNEGVVIRGNKIGTDFTGANPIQTRSGIIVGPYTSRYFPLNTVIGGPNPEDANTIAYTETSGVYVSSLSNGVDISGNSIHSNDAFGIDLLTNSGASEPNPNDPLDNDSGGNGLQNYPVTDLAESDGVTTRVMGTLPTAPSNAYRVEFFASPVCSPLGFGQALLFLGRDILSTDAAGAAPFDITLSTPTPEGWVVTATATDLSTNSTSEFSACVDITTTSGCAADMAEPFGSIDFSDVSAFLAMFSATDSGADLAEPLGQFDFSDVSAFLAAFGAGCP